jgi:ubiquinone/menaquinone biosynthesis C-methylase UbiE
MNDTKSLANGCTQVYGATFARYSRQDMEEFIAPLAIRFARNGLDPHALFEGARCLDAGCGNGRGMLFALSHGAAEVTCVDVSAMNLETTRHFAEDFGVAKSVTFRESALESLDFPDQHFDFVWCNGVIMHTGTPSRSLAEISRVLCLGGRMWLYMYGAGGVYWRVIRRFRELLGSLSPARVEAMLELMRYETRYRAEFLDDWYTPNLRTYTAADLETALVHMGFAAPALLPYGVDYDTSQRRSQCATDLERELMGDGDLRYLLTKTDHRPGPAHLNDGPLGSSVSWPASVTELVDDRLDAFAEACGDDYWPLLAGCALIQRELRLLMSRPGPFAADEFRQWLDAAVRLVTVSRRD